MDIEKLRILLKDNKYVLIDYTDKFKLDIDYKEITKNQHKEMEMIIKCMDIFKEMDNKLMKNTNLLFLLDIS